MVSAIGGAGSKGGASKGSSGSAKLSEKKLRKMESAALEEKLVMLRAALFNEDGSDRDPTVSFGPFKSFDRNGLNVAIEFTAKLPRAVRTWAFDLTKENMEEKYEAAGYGWDDEDKLKELSEDGARFLVVRAAPAEGAAAPGALVGYVHFRFTVQGDVVDKMVGDTVLMVHDIHLAEPARRKGLGRHLLQLLELVARRARMSRLSMQCLLGDDDARGFVTSLKRPFASDTALAELLDFDAELEGFDVFTTVLAPPVARVAPAPPTADEAAATTAFDAAVDSAAAAAAAPATEEGEEDDDEDEEDDEAAGELRQMRALLRAKVIDGFAAQHERAPSADEEATLFASVDEKLAGLGLGGGGGGGFEAKPLSGAELRAKKRADRARAEACLAKSLGHAPSEEELAEFLAAVTPGGGGAPATPTGKHATTAAADSPSCVVDEAAATVEETN